MNEILLYGEIGFDPGLDAASVKYAIAAADPSEELVVRIDSPGGSVFQAFSIYESIKNYPGKTRAVIESSAFSAASYIAMACDQIEVARNGYIMIHNPSMTTDGDHDDHAKGSAMLVKIRDSMVEGYATRSRKTRPQIVEMMKAETYLSADDAVREGFADHVLPAGVSSRSAFAKGTPALVVARCRSGRSRTTTTAADQVTGNWELWTGLVAMFRRKGLAFSQAHREVERQDPGLRLRAVAEKNAR